MTITPKQCRAARELLDWNQTRLAKAANVSLSTISDFERGARTPITNNRTAIERALALSGIHLIGKTGVNLSRRKFR